MSSGRVRVLTTFASLALIAGCSSGGTAPPASPSPTPTAVAGGTTAILRFVSGLTIGAKSIVVAFPSAAPVTVALPSACQAAPPCSVSVRAQAGTDVGFHVSAFAGSTGVGTPIAVATATASFAVAQSTVVPVALEGLMANYALAFSPATLVSQIDSSLSVNIAPRDATGASIGTPFLTNSGQVPAFTLSLTDTSGATTSLGTGSGAPGDFTYNYTGILPNPKFVTATLPGYQNVTALVPVAPAPQGAIGYALYYSGPFNSTALGTATIFAPGSTTLVRSYDLGDAFTAFFDPAGTIWTVNQNEFVGVTAGGTRATPIVGLPASQYPTGFAPDGTLFALPTSSASNTINAYAIATNGNATLVRSLNVDASCGAPVADVSRNIYTACANGVEEFGPSGGSGSVPPVASNPSAKYPIAVDAKGNFYAQYCPAAPATCAIGVWLPGTFGPNVPNRTLPIALPGSNGLSGLGVDAQGDVYEFIAGFSFATYVYVITNGSSVPKQLSEQSGATLAVPF